MDAFGSCTFKMQFKTLIFATMNIIRLNERGGGGGGYELPGSATE